MKHSLSSKELTWTNSQSPGVGELAEFMRESRLTVTDAEFVAQKYHRPSVSIGPDYLLLLIQVPIFDRALRLTRGVALFFIVRPKQVLSLHYEPIVVLDKIRHDFELSPDKTQEYMGEEPLTFVMDIIGLLYDSAFNKLERLSKHIDIAEDAVFQGNEKKMVEEISFLTRDVMDFRKVVRPQTTLFAELPQHSMVNSEVAIKWRRIHGQLLRMWEMLESLFESTKELSNTNFTLLQHKQNELLRLLTVYSIVMVPMLILTDPYFSPNASGSRVVDKTVFWIVLSTLVITLSYIFWRFKRKNSA
jgi:magnesium transporter